MKVVAVLYQGGQVARANPNLLGSAENALGLKDFLKEGDMNSLC